MELTTQNESIFSKIHSFLKSFSATSEVELTIPCDIYYRTELMCECVGDELNLDFQVEHFMMALYMNFINESVTKYDPKRILQMITNVPNYNETMDIVVNGTKATFKKKEHNIFNITISMENNDIRKGELILSELEELFCYKISFGKMMSALWIDYIEEYKKGNNKKAYGSILKLLK